MNHFLTINQSNKRVEIVARMLETGIRLPLGPPLLLLPVKITNWMVEGDGKPLSPFYRRYSIDSLRKRCKPIRALLLARLMAIYAILDAWHPHINGKEIPEVRSDNPAFNSNEDFFQWCRQHGAENQWYLVE